MDNEVIKLIISLKEKIIKDDATTTSTTGVYNPVASVIDTEETTIKETIDECVSRKIPIFHDEHPDWSDDHVVAAAEGYCRDRVGKMSCKACNNILFNGHVSTCKALHKKNVLKKEFEHNTIQVFTVNRQADESGHSGTGHVITGIIFEDGSVVIRWNTETSSIGIYNNFEEFHMLHIGQHPTNESIIDSKSIIIDGAGKISFPKDHFPSTYF